MYSRKGRDLEVLISRSGNSAGNISNNNDGACKAQFCPVKERIRKVASIRRSEVSNYLKFQPSRISVTAAAEPIHFASESPGPLSGGFRREENVKPSVTSKENDAGAN